MIDTTSVTTSLARVLSLLRLDPEDRDAQKAAFRALLVRMGGQDVELQVTAQGLRVNGTRVPEATMGLAELRRPLLSHGIGELFIPGALAPAQLLQLIRAIAAPPETYARLQQLRDSLTEHGITGVRVAPPSMPQRRKAPRRREPSRPWAPAPPARIRSGCSISSPSNCRAAGAWPIC